MTLKAPRPLSPAYPRSPKTLGDHLRKRRLDLRLFQKDVAHALGVHETTVLNWEKNRTSPTLHLMPKVIKFLGYEPEIGEAETIAQKIIRYRQALGLSQEEMAKRMGIDPGTLGRLENEKGRPTMKILAKLVVRPDYHQC